VRDARRVRFMDEHIRAVHRAITDGVDVRGYFAWSLTDNFEWAAGYAQRFGLIHVDYQTLRRTPKDSFYWYQSLLRTQRSN
jgi:beta-glucosidase